MVRKHPKNRRAAVLAWVAVLLPLLLAMTGLSVDGARIFLGRAFLQASADVASLSGVIRLPSTGAALNAARTVLTTNEPSAGAALADGEVIFGRWDPPSRTFSAGAEPANALKLLASRGADHGNPLPLFFLPIIGQSFSDVHAVATAYGAPRVGGWYSGGLIGMERVDLGRNSTIDGYDINDGAYGGGNSGLPGTALANGSMTVHGSSVVSGSARPGVAYTEATVNGNATVEGETSALTRPLDLAPVDTPTSITGSTNDNSNITGTRNGKSINPLSNNGLNNGTNETVTIPSGNYYLSDFSVRGTVNITGPAKIRVTGSWDMTGQGIINTSGGPVEFYVEGTASLAGQGIANGSQDPRNLIINSTGPSVRWEGSSDFYGYIYGPFDPVVSIRGDANFFGGAVGRELVTAGNGDIHLEMGVGFDGPNRKLPVLVD